MSFSSAALALAWFVLALLVLVVAGVVRQVAALSASLGDCAGVGGRDLRCLPEAGSLFDQLGVPGAPFLMAVDAHGTITATLMPESPTHVRDWLRPTIPLHAKE